MQDKFYEIPIMIGAGMFLFLLLSVSMIVFLLKYQKNKFRHKEEIRKIEQSAAEERLKSQLEIQEQTFNAISNEIHDNVGQILSLAKVQLSIVEQGSPQVHAVFADAKENISRAMTDLRDIAKSLNSQRLEQTTLEEIIALELERIKKASSLQTLLQVQPNIKPIHAQKKLILFRIVQECLQNILKHAAARQVSVECSQQEELLLVIINDDGKGFSLEEKTGQGLGLYNIFNRARLIGGHAEIDSHINKGTTIKLTIPYE